MSIDLSKIWISWAVSEENNCNENLITLCPNLKCSGEVEENLNSTV